MSVAARVDLLEVLFDLGAFLRPDISDFSDDSVKVLAHVVPFFVYVVLTMVMKTQG